MGAGGDALAPSWIAADEIDEAVGLGHEVVNGGLLALGALQQPARRAEMAERKQPVIDEFRGQGVRDVDDMGLRDAADEVGERQIGGAHAVAVAAGAALGQAQRLHGRLG